MQLENQIYLKKNIEIKKIKIEHILLIYFFDISLPPKS